MRLREGARANSRAGGWRLLNECGTSFQPVMHWSSSASSEDAFRLRQRVLGLPHLNDFLMSGSALIIAAHGSRRTPGANQMVADYAHRLAERGWFDEVTPAFHDGEPCFSEVLDRLSADDVTVVPMMTSDGYFTNELLPRGLSRNKRASRIRLRQTKPVGLHPAVVKLVADRIDTLRSRCQLDRVCVSIVGHGTPRHGRSRFATIRLADALRAAHVAREVLPTFLDEEPNVDSLRSRTARVDLIVVPFLMTNGPHATHDIPRALGLTGTDQRVGFDPSVGSNQPVGLEFSKPPFAGWVDCRRVVCDAAIGTDVRIVELIAELALNVESVGSVRERIHAPAAQVRMRLAPSRGGSR